jgi:hypothetical protein
MISTRCEVCGGFGHFVIGPPTRPTAGRFCRDCLPAEWTWESDANKITATRMIHADVMDY